MSKNLSIIVACSIDCAIGRNNEIPWHLPEDLKLFKRLTLGKTVVMGRRTAESIGRPLPGRRNLVVTSGEAPFPTQTVVRSLQEAMELVADDEELMVIGGERLYAEALPLARTVHLSLVDVHVENADAFFPKFLQCYYRVVNRVEYPGSDGVPSFTYTEFRRHDAPYP